MVKNKVICVTFSRPGSHQLRINGEVLLDVGTEVELVREASKLGINFKQLEHKAESVPHGEVFHYHAVTTWYGTKEQLGYLAWKGTIGPGQHLRKIIKDNT